MLGLCSLALLPLAVVAADYDGVDFALAAVARPAADNSDLLDRCLTGLYCQLNQC